MAQKLTEKPEGWYSVSEIAKITGKSKQAIIWQCKKGKLEAVKYFPKGEKFKRGVWAVSQESFQKLIEKERLKGERMKEPIPIPENYPDDMYLTAEQVSDFTGYSVRTVGDYIRAGKLEAILQSRKDGFRVSVGTVRELIKEQAEKRSKPIKREIKNSTVENIADSPYEFLAMAVVRLAVKDYKNALKKEMKYRKTKSDNWYDALSQIYELEQFFRSQKFGNLTYNKIDSEWMINTIREEVNWG